MTYIKQKYAAPEWIRFVTKRTGCTEAQAIAELVAEEGDPLEAVRNLKGA